MNELLVVTAGLPDSMGFELGWVAGTNIMAVDTSDSRIAKIIAGSVSNKSVAYGSLLPEENCWFDLELPTGFVYPISYVNMNFIGISGTPVDTSSYLPTNCYGPFWGGDFFPGQSYTSIEVLAGIYRFAIGTQNLYCRRFDGRMYPVKPRSVLTGRLRPVWCSRAGYSTSAYIKIVACGYGSGGLY